jgi:threonine aldolase
MDLQDLQHVFRRDNDDHFAKTTLICLENTHNMTGGIALSKAYVDSVGAAAQSWDIAVHMDGARIFNAACALNISVASLCESVDSISVCLSKGLGAPLGSLVVGNAEWIRLAKRARKRVGGGMRQTGVVASMGMYALLNHVQRLGEDHRRARRIAEELVQHGFYQPQHGQVDTNIVYFALPEDCGVSKHEFVDRLASEYGVLIGYGYSRNGDWFRIVTHLDVDDECIDRAIEGILRIVVGKF